MKNKSLFFFTIFIFSTNAFSFDCSKAMSSTEKKICSNPYLQQADTEMNMYYKNLLGALPSHQLPQLRAEQLNWILNSRDRCGDEKCIEESYMHRLEDLFQKKSVCHVAVSQLGGDWTRVSEKGEYIGFSLGFYKEKTSVYSYEVAPEHKQNHRLLVSGGSWSYGNCQITSGGHVGKNYFGQDERQEPGENLKILRYDQINETLYLLSSAYFSAYKRIRK